MFDRTRILLGDLVVAPNLLQQSFGLVTAGVKFKCALQDSGRFFLARVGGSQITFALLNTRLKLRDAALLKQLRLRNKLAMHLLDAIEAGFQCCGLNFGALFQSP